MKFPSLEDLDHLDIPRGEDRRPWRVVHDGRAFEISGSWSIWIRTRFDDAHDLVVSCDPRRETRRRFLVYRDVRWVQNDVRLLPVGEEHGGTTLASGLTDTGELTGDVAGIRPLVEACLAAFRAELPGFRAAMAAREAEKRAEEAAKDAKRDARADALLALFEGVRSRDITVTARDKRAREGAWLIRGGGDVVIEVGGHGYAVHPRATKDTDGDVSIWLHNGDRIEADGFAASGLASLTITDRDEDDRPLKKWVEGSLMVGWRWFPQFRSTAEIADPRARALACQMLQAIAEHDRRALAALRARDDEREQQALAAREAVSGVSSGRVTAETVVRVPFASRGHHVRFRHLSDGTWASDALLAVQRGREGETIYAEAIHLPRATSLPREIVVGPEHLRSLRDQAPRIIGWVLPRRPAGASADPAFTPTADPSLDDADYVLDPAAPPPSVAPAGARR